MLELQINAASAASYMGGYSAASQRVSPVWCCFICFTIDRQKHWATESRQPFWRLRKAHKKDIVEVVGEE